MQAFIRCHGWTVRVMAARSTRCPGLAPVMNCIHTSAQLFELSMQLDEAEGYASAECLAVRQGADMLLYPCELLGLPGLVEL